MMTRAELLKAMGGCWAIACLPNLDWIEKVLPAEATRVGRLGVLVSPGAEAASHLEALYRVPVPEAHIINVPGYGEIRYPGFKWLWADMWAANDERSGGLDVIRAQVSATEAMVIHRYELWVPTDDLRGHDRKMLDGAPMVPRHMASGDSWNLTLRAA